MNGQSAHDDGGSIHSVDDQRQRLAALVFETSILLLTLFIAWNAVCYPVPAGAKSHPLTVIGFLFSLMNVSPLVIVSPTLLGVLKWSLSALILYWILGRANRWVYALTPLVFVVLMSAEVESHFFVKHQSHFCVMALVVLGAARFFGSVGHKSFAQVNPLPRWAFLLLMFYMGISYSFSGITKLVCSGFEWGDGRALMMWVDVFSIRRNNLLFDLITGSRPIAATMQMVTLTTETLAILIFFVPKSRIVIGALLCGFHVSVEILFGHEFYANIFMDFWLLVVLYFVPYYQVDGWAFFRGLVAPYPSEIFETSSRVAHAVGEKSELAS